MSSCCDSSKILDDTIAFPTPREVIGIVNAAYSVRAREGVTANYARNVAEAFGYTQEQLSTVPDGAHMGLSCGNPVATATIKEGETVVDLGSGGGIDVFLAAAKVGENGCVIGLDMSQDMINLARANATKKGLKPPHVAFIKAQLTETLPIESNSVDCILSNCVVNLLPLDGKAALLKEINRILKPGGRIVLDDIVAKKPLPDNIKNNLASYVGCISGAILVDEYKALLDEANFTKVLFVDTKSDLGVYYRVPTEDGNVSNNPSCFTPVPTGHLSAAPDYDVNHWVASYQIFAIKDGISSPGTPALALSRWWDAYPSVFSSPRSLKAHELASIIRDQTQTSTFAVIDVRKNDHAGGHVRGSYNWAAQSFYDDLPSFYQEFKNFPKVIFYCQSSNGRGPRCAGWYQDYLDAQGDGRSTAFILEGGIKQWLTDFGKEEDLVDFD
ncbi:hypothetical protein HYPSUDRAFT_171339 [Hypholoma sublateritium FD-334 SS-4]|uniref:Arsenite methyltransferase n=1 Tax=Hypholoma sublateritium (strain FD-334 SS-4) TaxID=945553 RepID=A0A0D2M019_HYPSF|nr:hypothetical protein HYPSUDRAFT_171339 [Hypholoma sublateritium FD-334 SS-4]